MGGDSLATEVVLLRKLGRNEVCNTNNIVRLVLKMLTID
jgi:hypothetical protein